MFCQKCGTQLPNDAKFCNHCGAELRRQGAAPSQGPDQGSRSSSRPSHAENQKPESSSRKSSIGAKIQAVLVVVAILAASAFLAYGGQLFGGDGSNPPGTGESQPSVLECKEPRGMDPEAFPLYAILPDREKVVYEEAMECIEKGDESFSPTYKLNENIIQTIMTYLYYEQPQLFWFSPSDNRFVTDSETGAVAEIQIGYNRLADDLELHKQQIEDAADPILQQAASLSEIEAERFFHDYICETVTYRYGINDQNIYSAFVEKKRYAQAMPVHCSI